MINISKYFSNLPFYQRKQKRNCKLNNLIKKSTHEIEINDLDHLLKYQTTLDDLKIISLKHKIKIKGKKNDKIYTCYNLLFLKINILKIIKTWKRYIYFKISQLQGPAKYNRKLCNNKEDFLTMETMNEIDIDYFFSFQDEDNFIYGFNLKSIKQMIDKKQLFNPYNRKPLNKFIINIINERIKFNKLANIDIDEKVQQDNNNMIFNIDTQIRNKVIQLFQYMDVMGYNTNIDWFLNLSRNGLIRFIRELFDIWNYRAGLNIIQKQEICPSGNPFRNMNIFLLNIITTPDIVIKNMAIKIMTQFLSPNTNEGNKNVCAMYILSALTLVSRDAAETLPWLYQSVST